MKELLGYAVLACLGIILALIFVIKPLHAETWTPEAMEQRIEDCLSDYVIDWESPLCEFMHPQDYPYPTSYNYNVDEYDEHEMIAELPE